MYMDDDTLTPRDRISDDMLRRMLGESDRDLSEQTYPEQKYYSNNTTLNDTNRSSNHMHHTWGLEDHPLAMMYAPIQQFRNLYDRDTAMDKGTIFSELDLPFRGERVTKGGSCCDGTLS